MLPPGHVALSQLLRLSPEDVAFPKPVEAGGRRPSKEILSIQFARKISCHESGKATEVQLTFNSDMELKQFEEAFSMALNTSNTLLGDPWEKRYKRQTKRTAQLVRFGVMHST